MRPSRSSPRDDEQASLKAQAVTMAMNLGQMKVLLMAQTTPRFPGRCWPPWCGGWSSSSCSSVCSPLPTRRPGTALVAASVSVAVAVFLVMELDQPLGGIIRIPSEPMLRAMSEFTR